jgi:hypothetical protein
LLMTSNEYRLRTGLDRDFLRENAVRLGFWVVENMTEFSMHHRLLFELWRQAIEKRRRTGKPPKPSDPRDPAPEVYALPTSFDAGQAAVKYSER